MKLFKNQIAVFSLKISLLVTLFLLLVFTIYTLKENSSNLIRINNDVFQNIHCGTSICSTDKYFNLGSVEPADYIYTNDGFVLDSKNINGFWINYADVNFIRKYNSPSNYTSLSGETWRLLSTTRQIDNITYDIIIGVILNAPFRLFIVHEDNYLDSQLYNELNIISSQIPIGLKDRSKITIFTKSDGYQIVQSNTQEIIDASGGLPSFIPINRLKDIHNLFMNDSMDVYLVNREQSDMLNSIALAKVTNLRDIIFFTLNLYVLTSIIIYILNRTLFKKLWIFYRKDFPSLEQALSKGEGDKIEFKKGIFDDDILKSIAAFSNTRDGVVFVGIDDNAHPVGANLATPKDKEIFVHKICSLVRARIRPLITIDIDFQNIRDCVIAIIKVPRGSELFYFLDGIIYSRYGDSDIKAEPEMVKKMAEHRI